MMKDLRAPLVVALTLCMLFTGCMTSNQPKSPAPPVTSPHTAQSSQTPKTPPPPPSPQDETAATNEIAATKQRPMPAEKEASIAKTESVPSGSAVASAPKPQPQSVAPSVDGVIANNAPMGRADSAAAGKAKTQIAQPERKREEAARRQESNDKKPDIAKNGEGYTDYGVNQMIVTEQDRFSTFAIDVDTASYTIARRKLNEGQLPPQSAVRVEEFVNYFKYRYPQPNGAQPISINIDGAPSPFNAKRHLLRVGLQGKQVPAQQRQPAHLTFLVDVSGSMNSPDKLGMVKQSLGILVDNLKQGDTVAITTYAGGVRLVLPPTGVEEKGRIIESLNQLVSGGSTAMASGIMLAYQQAYATKQPNSINRVVICSDGDANVGNTSPTEILKQIEAYARQGITVSTIGFGNGNYQDTMMEQFADKGNGNYYYIDSIAQAKRVFGQQLTGTLQVIAKDVKVQLEFNPIAISGYRLIGYENRDVADADFRKDHIDGGEIGAGHTVTALYEVILKQQAAVDNLVTVRVRYKAPNEDQSREIEQKFSPQQLVGNFSAASDDFRFATSVAAFAEVLRHSREARSWSLSTVSSIAQSAARTPERLEMIEMITRAQQLK